MKIDGILELLKMFAPAILKSCGTRLKDAAVSEFLRTLAPPATEVYEFPDGAEQEVKWTHLLLGDDVVIGIGRKGEKVRTAKRVK